MTNRTITARSSTLTGQYGGANYANGSVVVDDATASGRKAIAYAKRHGWAVSDGTAAVAVTVAQGKPVSTWTKAECIAYLTPLHVEFPSNALVAELRNVVQTAYETRAQGGSAALPAAGHTQGTFPVEGAPDVPGDDETKTPFYHTPVTIDGVTGDDVLPAITTQPANASRVAPATAAFTVAATGTPTPTVQWQVQNKGVGEFVDIEGATALTYTTPATSVANDNGDKFRAVLTNQDGTATSNVATLTVTSA